jgi:hypothetical protein
MAASAAVAQLGAASYHSQLVIISDKMDDILAPFRTICFKKVIVRASIF